MQHEVRLDNGDAFPSISMTAVGGKMLDLPDPNAAWQVVLLYRGRWCSFCRAQLDDFNAQLSALRELDVQVVAISTDTQSEAEAIVAEQHLSFPVGYGVNARAIAGQTGAYFDPAKNFLHATSFLLERGRIYHATYSTGPLGRLDAKHVLRLVTYLNQKRAETSVA